MATNISGYPLRSGTFVAACIPGNISFFKYDWTKEAWNLFFVAGILLGGTVATQLLSNLDPIVVASATAKTLQALNIHVDNSLMPSSIFSAENPLSLKGLIFSIGGGFLAGFGTRYADGCTSGHAIMGLFLRCSGIKNGCRRATHRMVK